MVSSRKLVCRTPVTIQGLAPQFARELPGVRQTNFLDDTMLPEINAAGEITPAVRCRFYALAAAAAASRPDAILCACSSVGGLLEEARGIVSVPVSYTHLDVYKRQPMS